MAAAVIVVTAIRPKPGQHDAVLGVLRRHHGILKLQGLVTDFKPIVARGPSGELVEILELKSRDAEKAAATNAAVKDYQDKLLLHADVVRLGELPGETFERVHVPVGL